MDFIFFFKLQEETTEPQETLELKSLQNLVREIYFFNDY